MLLPKDIRAIQACVHDLDYLIENWDYFAAREAVACITLNAGDTTYGILDVQGGLCRNVFEPNRLSDHIKICMFIAWDDFSGDPIYPVGGMDEYESDECKNLYRNPDRKALALHCVDYLNRLLELK